MRAVALAPASGLGGYHCAVAGRGQLLAKSNGLFFSVFHAAPFLLIIVLAAADYLV